MTFSILLTIAVSIYGEHDSVVFMCKSQTELRLAQQVQETEVKNSNSSLEFSVFPISKIMKTTSNHIS